MKKKGRINKRYNADFKISVIPDMNEHGSGYRETARKYGLVTQSMVGAIYTLIVGNAYTLKKEPKAL